MPVSLSVLSVIFNMMIMKRINRHTLLAAALLALVSCQRPLETDFIAEPIRFTALAGASDDTGEAQPATRLSYGAVNGSTQTIRWNLGDRICIWSPDAVILSSGEATHPALSYSVSSVSGESAGITAVNAPGRLMWGNDGRKNAFFGKYPDPSWEDAAPYDHASFRNQSRVSPSFLCYLPASTSFSPATGTYTYAQDMSYCYMTAYASVTKGSEVNLSFIPAVSTFRFLITNGYVENKSVTGVKLSSAAHRLSGEYTVGVAATPNYNVPETSLSTGDKSVVASFSTPVTIPEGNPLKVTLFTCPVTVDDLTLTITYSDESQSSIELKKDGVWYSFQAGKFFDITVAGNGLGPSPDPDIYFYDMAPISDIRVSGQAVVADTDHAVTVSTEKDPERGYGGTGNATPWKAYYCTSEPTVGTSVTDNAAFSAAPPSWLSVLAGGSGTGSADDFSFRVNGAVAEGAAMIPGPSAQAMINILKNHTMVQASQPGYPYCFLQYTYFDPETQRLEYSPFDSSHRATANCYIVNGAGYFCLPLIYGNGNVDGYSLNFNPDDYWVDPDTGEFIQNNNYRFQNADGRPMQNNLILSDDNLSKPGPYNACVLWQDTPTGFEIVKDADVSLAREGSNHQLVETQEDPYYLVFKIDADNIKPGNVVLALRDATGKILWSWHIWVRADIDEGANKLRVNDVTYYTNFTTKQLGTMRFLSEPLGWAPPIDYREGHASPRHCYVAIASTETNEVMGSFKVSTDEFSCNGYASGHHYSACYYQWGRKDPFPGSNGASTHGAMRNKVVTSSNPEYNMLADGKSLKTRNCNTFGERVRYPYRFNTNMKHSETWLWNNRDAGAIGIGSPPLVAETTWWRDGLIRPQGLTPQQLRDLYARSRSRLALVYDYPTTPNRSRIAILYPPNPNPNPGPDDPDPKYPGGYVIIDKFIFPWFYEDFDYVPGLEFWSANTWVAKTVYDPCPAGFHVPEAYAFSGCIPPTHTHSLDWSDYYYNLPAAMDTYIWKGHVKDSGTNGEKELYGHYYRSGEHPGNQEWPATFSMTNNHSGDRSSYTVNVPALGWRGYGVGDVALNYQNHVYNSSYPEDYYGNAYCYYWLASAVLNGFSDGLAGCCMWHGLGAGFDIVGRNRITDGFSIMAQLEEGSLSNIPYYGEDILSIGDYTKRNFTDGKRELLLGCTSDSIEWDYRNGGTPWWEY